MRHFPPALLALGVLLGPTLGCATVLRGNQRDLTIYGPEDLQIAADGVPTAIHRQGGSGGRVEYKATLPKNTKFVALQSGGVRVPSHPLEESASAGWVILDVFLIVYIAPLLIDWSTGAWNNYNDLDATTPLALAGAGAPRTGEVGPRRVAAQAPSQAPPPTPVVAAQPVRTAGPARPVVERGKLAVLDFRNFAADLKPEDVRYFADVVRGAVLHAAPGLDVMTRENLLVLLQSTGKDLAHCEGECEVDTGRRIGADAVISGEILKVGTRYKMSLKLHETSAGRLLSTSVASGKSIDELDEGAQAASNELLLPKR